MNLITTTRRQTLRSLAAAAVWPALARAAADPALPGDSIYRLDAHLVDQDGHAFTPGSLQGAPVLASMFYTSCQMVCPMIFETIQANLRALPPAERAAAKVLMVSFDPAHDAPPALKEAARAHGCDSRWTLATCDEATARKVAAVLGIQYRRLSNGEFNHSTVIEVIDRRGRIVARSGKLGSADPALVAAVRRVYSAA